MRFQQWLAVTVPVSVDRHRAYNIRIS